MTDWSKPLVAVNLQNGSHVAASIDKSFAPQAGGVFVKVAHNVWTGGMPAGTWHFNDSGEAVAGIGPDGYEGRLHLRNAS